MKKKLKTYLVILLQLILGMALLILSEKIPGPHWLRPAFILCFAFLLLNLIQAAVFKLQSELKEYWSLRKLHLLIIGALGGTGIALAPTGIALITGRSDATALHFNTELSLVSAALTFAVVSWEELWFRGLFLNYSLRNLSAVHLSLLMGSLFMLMHALNPAINLLQTGPSLFFAGALLTLLYFYCKSIWMPLGLHFGNNFSGTFFTSGQEQDLFFGSEGYLQTLILATLFLVLFLKIKKQH